MRVFIIWNCINPRKFSLKIRTNALDRWLSNNHHGEMKWMEAEKRKNISLLLEGAKSVLSVDLIMLVPKTIIRTKA